MSIQRQEYYGNPRNLFWKIISGVYMEELPDSYEDKKALLARHGIVLWDVYASAMREGSLDANIRGGEFNDLAAFLAKHNGIEIVATNGGEARKSLKRYVRQRGHISDGDVSIIHFRSTSPMVRTSGWTIDMLIRQWSELKNQKI